YNKVLSNSSKALTIEPDFVPILILRGSAYYHLKKYNKAIEDFSKALKIEPNNETVLKYVKNASNEFNFTSMKDT
ncbi:24064_t:CDS:1, partial [Gigaspora rosea]